MDNATFNSTDYNSTTNGTDSPFPPLPVAKPFWTNLLLPTLYLAIVIGSLYTFTTLYKNRQLAKSASLAPWFPAHTTRDIYLSLLHLDPSEDADKSGGKTLSRVPDSVLKAALLRRAVTDIQRIVILRSSKQALQTLLQRGSVGDELWQRFQVAEQEMEAEVKDVVTEANAFAPNWGQIIFQSANEINQNILLKQRTAEIQAQLESEKSWWESKRSGIQSDFMKEIGAAPENTTETDVPAKAIEAPRKTGSSDDDTVLVEAGGPAQPQGSVKGKKKGKK